jgi:hypothetical protein
MTAPYHHIPSRNTASILDPEAVIRQEMINAIDSMAALIAINGRKIARLEDLQRRADAEKRGEGE